MSETTETKEEAKPAGGGANLVPLLVGLINTLAILGVTGFFYYTKFVFKRPIITETGERAKLAADPKPKIKQNPGVVPFDPLTVNILEKSALPTGRDALREPSAIIEKPESFHYITLSYELQLQDIGEQEKLIGYKTLITDKTLQFVGKKTFEELNSVNGRFILKNELLDFINEILRTRHGLDGLVTDLYFTQFTLQ